MATPVPAPVLSVVVPFFNEAGTADQVVGTIHNRLLGLGRSFELILVDDGSVDATWSLLSAQAAARANIVALRLSRNFGKEAALAAGLVEARGAAVVLLDGDLQHPPELIADMLALWERGEVDVVEAVKSRRGKEAWWLRWGAKLFYTALARTGGASLEGATDFKLLDRRVVDAWRAMGERNIFFRGMSAWLGFRRAQIPFAVPDRVGGHSQWSLRKLIKLGVTGITAFTSLPLHLTTLMGLCFLVFSVLLGGQTLYMKLTGQAVSGFATVILLLLILGSCVMISLGVIGIYIARIYEEVKARPRFVLADRVGTKPEGEEPRR